MSQAHHDAINVSIAGIGVDKNQPDSSSFDDGSGPIFSMYLEMATEEDKKMVENWKADADGMLIFTGLFSAALAALIAVSIQDIRQNPQDISNFYLENTYKATINPNISSSLPTSPPSFSPPHYAVWVNALWFLSLVISLTCALLATFLQQWARRYLKLTQTRYKPHKRARIRAFFFEGVDKCLLPWAVEILPTLLHISLFLFFAGLVVFLSNVNLTILKVVSSWVGICAAVYGCITLTPIIRHDSPYYTPLSSLVWSIVTGMAFFVSLVSGLLLYWTVFGRRGADWLIDRAECYLKSLLDGMQKTSEETALKSPSEIDTRAFVWTFESLDEDHELERFFDGLPGFRSSKVVDDPLPRLSWDQIQHLRGALDGLLNPTLSSDLLSESVKKRRAMILAKALDLKHFPFAVTTLRTILNTFQYSSPLATGIAENLKGWRNDRDEATALTGQAFISEIVARTQPRDDSWFTLASKELCVPEAVLRDYAAHGDSLSLAILIYLTRQQFSHLGNQHWPSVMFSFVLLSASKFLVGDTSPDLQHQFCALWNEIVRKVQNDSDRKMAELLLGRIRLVYVALHDELVPVIPIIPGFNTIDLRIPGDSPLENPPLEDFHLDPPLDDPSSYAVCNVPGHYWHPYPTPYILPPGPPRRRPDPVVPHIPVPMPSPSRNLGPDITYAPAESTDALSLHNNIAY